MKRKLNLNSFKVESFITKSIRGGFSSNQEELYPSINCEQGERSYTCPGG
ncbi:MAG: pinensin family lanthipeptide [Cyclobacteriaceae bacterium]